MNGNDPHTRLIILTYTFSVSDPGNDTYAVTTGKPDCGTGDEE